VNLVVDGHGKKCEKKGRLNQKRKEKDLFVEL
jgi:hypothetical protein